jgi:uncharacterized membrane protein YcaP (DUF421 family)
MNLEILIFDLYILSNLFAIFQGFKSFRNLDYLKTLLIMLLASIIQSISLYTDIGYEYALTSVFIYMVIEYSAIVYYFFSVLQNTILKNTILAAFGVSLVYLVYQGLTNPRNLNYNNPMILIF